MKNDYDVIVIGGGPAGLAAAIKAHDQGAKVLILEREGRLGGILNQCIHNGFGLTRFKQSLTGPEYAAKFIKEADDRAIDRLLSTTVLEIGQDKSVTAINSEQGIFTLKAKAVVLAMGCRERSRGAINVSGSRPAGVYSAGTAQKYVNVMGYLPGKRVVILGSGDIGLIMARRMTLEGAKVLAVCEIMPYSSGLRRNIEQCLNDFNIPLYLSHTVTAIEGDGRVTGVTVSKVDENKRPIKGTEMHFDCDTVLFSVGLIPENELTKQAGIRLSSVTRGATVDQTRRTEVEGIFACGNVLQVHDLVDFVSEEAEIAGQYAALYALNGEAGLQTVDVCAGEYISYVVPQRINKDIDGNVKLYFRVKREIRDCTFEIADQSGVVAVKKRAIAVPGEMETVIIPKDKIKNLVGPIVVRTGER